MQKYFENAIFFDLIFSILICVLIHVFKSNIAPFVCLPSFEILKDFVVSLITVSASLLGFLLTIITVIVTFKKGFEIKPESDLNKNEDATIFDVKKSKDDLFYNTPIYTKVINVFFNASYELSLIIFFLLLVQFNISTYSSYWISIMIFLFFSSLVLTTIRSLYIFKLFLNVYSKV